MQIPDSTDTVMQILDVLNGVSNLVAHSRLQIAIVCQTCEVFDYLVTSVNHISRQIQNVIRKLAY